MSDKEREALRQIVAMDPEGKRADDLGRAVRIARAALEAPATSAHAVACPHCWAEAGKLCRWPDLSASPYQPHEDRKAAARAALDATPAEPSAVELTDGVIEAICHRTAWRYKFSSDPRHSSMYTFNKACLIAFARAVLDGSGKAPQPSAVELTDEELQQIWYECGLGKEWDIPAGLDEIRFARAVLAAAKGKA
jgi:hypothetical protein